MQEGMDSFITEPKERQQTRLVIEIDDQAFLLPENVIDVGNIHMMLADSSRIECLGDRVWKKGQDIQVALYIIKSSQIKD